MTSIDLNCDLGEGAGCDEQLMPLITSANIACGGHAGDDASMRGAVRLAKQCGVNIGAHPSYPDRLSFGRVEMQMSLDALTETVEAQIRSLQQVVEDEQARLHHVKPHGALYNVAAKNRDVADAIVQAILRIDPKLVLVGLSGSVMIDVARSRQLCVAQEAFADRTYQPDGTLTPRSQPNAVIEHESAALLQAIQIIQQRKVTAVTGQTISLSADTICVHGDGRTAVGLLLALRKEFAGIDVRFRAF